MSLLPGPTKDDCPCGCGLYGLVTKTGHVRGCIGVPGEPCRKCIGRRNKIKGRTKQRKAQVALGMVGPGSSFGANHEENWMGLLRVEVKAGAQVRPAATAFRKMREQSEASRPIGDNRPFLGIAMPDGTSDGIALCRVSDLQAIAIAIVEQMGEDGAV